MGAYMQQKDNFWIFWKNTFEFKEDQLWQGKSGRLTGEHYKHEKNEHQIDFLQSIESLLGEFGDFEGHFVSLIFENSIYLPLKAKITLLTYIS